ncbi:MAG: hypothetical protein VB094_05275 [Oscillibacter sp.]|nr:hypothetical protein [Oscillibacter sp.]
MEQQYEIIKAMAYGQSDEEIAAAEGMAVEEVAAIRTAQEGQIEAAKADLRKAGYTE